MVTIKRCYFILLSFFLLICISSCEQNTIKDQIPGAFPDNEIIKNMGMKYDDFMEKFDLNQANDTMLFTKNTGKTTIKQKVVDDEIVEFALKKDEKYFDHEFKPFYSFSSHWGLNVVRFYGSIEKQDDSLVVLKQISDYLSDQYSVSPTYYVPSEQRILEFLKRDKESQKNILNELRQSSSSLSDQWVIQESLPNDPERRLVVEVSYIYGTDEQTKTEKALITVSYVCERKNIDIVKEKLS